MKTDEVLKAESELSPHTSERGGKEEAVSDVVRGAENLETDKRVTEEKKRAEPKKGGRRVDVFLTEELDSGRGETKKSGSKRKRKEDFRSSRYQREGS